MYREMSITEFSGDLLNQLNKGAFLIVKSKEKLNVMTISCGSIGFTWMKPTFTIMVRRSRYTYELMEESENYTVSFPFSGQLKNELAVCGTMSGRNIDKIKECRFSLKEGSLTNTFILDECEFHLECKIIYKHLIDKTKLDSKIKENIYANEDYHVLYFGEIVRAYKKDD